MSARDAWHPRRCFGLLCGPRHDCLCMHAVSRMVLGLQSQGRVRSRLRLRRTPDSTQPRLPSFPTATSPRVAIRILELLVYGLLRAGSRACLESATASHLRPAPSNLSKWPTHRDASAGWHRDASPALRQPASHQPPGSVKLKVLPWPGALFTPTWPPSFVTISSTTDNPNPCPLARMELSRVKGLNNRA